MKIARFLFVWLATMALMASPSPHTPVQAAIGSSHPRVDAHQALAIVVNRSNPVENLSLAELRKIFMGERSRWPSGHRVVVTMMESGNSERNAVLREIYDMNESAYRDYFLRERYTGDAPASPKTLSSAIILRKFVFNTPGAIGYLRASDVDDSVKVVSIDGRLPDEIDYKLRMEDPAK